MGPRRIASAHCCPAGPGAAPSRPAASAPAELPAPADRYWTRRARPSPPTGAAAPRVSVQGQGTSAAGRVGPGLGRGTRQSLQTRGVRATPSALQEKGRCEPRAPLFLHTRAGGGPLGLRPSHVRRHRAAPSREPTHLRRGSSWRRPGSGGSRAPEPAPQPCRGCWLGSPLHGRRSRGPAAPLNTRAPFGFAARSARRLTLRARRIALCCTGAPGSHTSARILNRVFPPPPCAPSWEVCVGTSPASRSSTSGLRFRRARGCSLRRNWAACLPVYLSQSKSPPKAGQQTFFFLKEGEKEEKERKESPIAK